MTRRNDPKIYFCRRRLRSVGPYSRRELLRLLLAGQINASTLIRRVGESSLRPLAMSEVADLIADTGQIWSRWASPWRLWGLMLLWPLLAGGALRLQQWLKPDLVWGPYLALAVIVLGLLLWIYRLWRIALGEPRPYRALIYSLPLMLPVVGWLWVWPGYYGLAHYLKVLCRRRKLAAGSLEPLFLAVIMLYYLSTFGLLGRWTLPGFQSLPVVFELVFVATIWYLMIVFSLLWADQLATRVLKQRTEAMIGSLLGVICQVDYSSLFQAERWIRIRLRRSTQWIALIVMSASLAPQIRLDFCEIAAIHARHFLAGMPAPPPLPEEWYRRSSLRGHSAIANLKRAQLADDVPATLEALARLGDVMQSSLGEYSSVVPGFVLYSGEVLLQDAEALANRTILSDSELAGMRQRFQDEEFLLRKSALDAVRRYIHSTLTVLPSTEPFAVNAALEAAEALPVYTRMDLYEFLLDLKCSGVGRPGERPTLRQPEARLTALRFFLRVNTTLLSFRILQTMFALELYERVHGRYPESLQELTPEILPEVPRNPLTGQFLGYRLLQQNDEDVSGRGFLLMAGGWPGVPLPPYADVLAPAVRVWKVK